MRVPIPDGSVTDFTCVLKTPATAEEVKEVDDYLTKNSDRRPTAIGNIAWALLASTEFCINH